MYECQEKNAKWNKNHTLFHYSLRLPGTLERDVSEQWLVSIVLKHTILLARRYAQRKLILLCLTVSCVKTPRLSTAGV
jgi:hypothetical protein